MRFNEEIPRSGLDGHCARIAPFFRITFDMRGYVKKRSFSVITDLLLLSLCMLVFITIISTVVYRATMQGNRFLVLNRSTNCDRDNGQQVKKKVRATNKGERRLRLIFCNLAQGEEKRKKTSSHSSR